MLLFPSIAMGQFSTPSSGGATDSFYIDYADTFNVEGWVNGGDTIWVDTTTASSGSDADSIKGKEINSVPTVNGTIMKYFVTGDSIGWTADNTAVGAGLVTGEDSASYSADDTLNFGDGFDLESTNALGTVTLDFSELPGVIDTLNFPHEANWGDITTGSLGELRISPDSVDSAHLNDAEISQYITTRVDSINLGFIDSASVHDSLDILRAEMLDSAAYEIGDSLVEYVRYDGDVLSGDYTGIDSLSARMITVDSIGIGTDVATGFYGLSEMIDTMAMVIDTTTTIDSTNFDTLNVATFIRNHDDDGGGGADKADTSISITGTGSLGGGGNLQANRTITLNSAFRDSLEQVYVGNFAIDAIDDSSIANDITIDHATSADSALIAGTSYIADSTEAGLMTDFWANSIWSTYYSDGSKVMQELALGTDTYVLTSNGPAIAPSWQAPGAGTGTPDTVTITDHVDDTLSVPGGELIIIFTEGVSST